MKPGAPSLCSLWPSGASVFLPLRFPLEPSMSTPTTATTTQQLSRRGNDKRRITPGNTGTIDPRPLTEYEVSVADDGEGNTLVKIALMQPCIIRKPDWAFIDCADGSRVYA